MKNKLILGLTGGSGTGKSSVLKHLKAKGAYVIDGDSVARKVVENGKPALLEIKAHFGESVINPDGSLARRKLGNIVFSDKKSLDILNKITHKYIKDEILEEIKNTDKTLVAIEAAELFEGGLGGICDFTIAVLADIEIRKKRIIERDCLTLAQAENRIMSQKSDEYYINHCDFCVKNDGKITDMITEINKIIEKLETDNAKSD